MIRSQVSTGLSVIYYSYLGLGLHTQGIKDLTSTVFEFATRTIEYLKSILTNQTMLNNREHPSSTDDNLVVHVTAYTVVERCRHRTS